MSTTLQLVIVAVVVLAAAAYIGRRVWKKITQHESAGCGTGCGTCSQAGNPSPNVVSLESLTSSIDHLPPSRN